MTGLSIEDVDLFEINEVSVLSKPKTEGLTVNGLTGICQHDGILHEDLKIGPRKSERQRRCDCAWASFR